MTVLGIIKQSNSHSKAWDIPSQTAKFIHFSETTFNGQIQNLLPHDCAVQRTSNSHGNMPVLSQTFLLFTAVTLREDGKRNLKESVIDRFEHAGILDAVSFYLHI